MLGSDVSISKFRDHIIETNLVYLLSTFGFDVVNYEVASIEA